MLIRALVHAESPEEAVDKAASRVFERLTRDQHPFDYFVTFDHEPGEHRVAGGDRWGNDTPAAVLADSEEGRELIEEGMEATEREFRENLAAVKLALEHLSDEEIREMEADHDIDLRERLSEEEIEQVAEDHDVEHVKSLFDVRHAMRSIGMYAGPSIWLYDGTDWSCGSGIRSRTTLQTIKERAEDDDRPLYVVPADVHF